MDSAHNCVVIGMTRAGKTTWLMEQIRKFKRVIVWDPKGEYCRDKKNKFKQVNSISALARLLRKRKAGRFALTVDVNRANWELCNAAVLAWGNCAYVAEEVGDVTTQGKAPAMWGRIIRRGSDRDIRLFAVAHRFTEIDTTIRGNVTKWHFHRQQRLQDRINAAAELDIEPGRLVLERFDYLEWTDDGKISTGTTKKAA